MLGIHAWYIVFCLLSRHLCVLNPFQMLPNISINTNSIYWYECSITPYITSSSHTIEDAGWCESYTSMLWNMWWALDQILVSNSCGFQQLSWCWLGKGLLHCIYVDYGRFCWIILEGDVLNASTSTSVPHCNNSLIQQCELGKPKASGALDSGTKIIAIHDTIKSWTQPRENLVGIILQALMFCIS